VIDFFTVRRIWHFEIRKYFILVLYKGFRYDLRIVLNRAQYSQASVDTGRQVHDDLAFVTLPLYSPKRNPVEECWWQLQTAPINRFFHSFGELTTTIDTGLDHYLFQKWATISDYYYSAICRLKCWSVNMNDKRGETG
jgi:hypothetical protein